MERDGSVLAESLVGALVPVVQSKLVEVVDRVVNDNVSCSRVRSLFSS